MSSCLRFSWQQSRSHYNTPGDDVVVDELTNAGDDVAATDLPLRTKLHVLL